MYFLAYLVVSSIQMGATIDYAIVFTNRYLELKETMDNKQAASTALNQSFPTILTSGSILTLAGFLIGMISTNAIISALGTALGRGTLISIVIVMMVLPQMDGVFYGLVKGDIDAKVELGNQQDLLLTESNEDNIKIDEKQEDEDNENNEEEQ